VVRLKGSVFPPQHLFVMVRREEAGRGGGGGDSFENKMNVRYF